MKFLGENSFYQDKTILITGHTGFKGSWLSIWLIELGAKVIGYSLAPATPKDNYVLTGLHNRLIDVRGDIMDKEKLDETILKYQPDIIFHLAAQPLVRLSYEKPIETWEVNVIGTMNVLDAMKKCPKTKVGIFITTDKCYENKEQLWGYRESDPMGGYDPYSSSKGAAEIAISSWRRSFFNPKEYEKHGKSIATVRAGNVVGGGDWAIDRIIPDCIRALENNEPIKIRNPKAIRPWQHVLEPLGGYLLLAEKMWYEPTKYCEGWNFGPRPESISSVWEIATKIIAYYGKGELKDLHNSSNLHEATLLTLDISKAQFLLNWKPKMNINQTIELTVDWYKRYKEEDVYTICRKQIFEYMNLTSPDII